MDDAPAPSRLQRLIEPRLRGDPGGDGWLGPLLAAAPRGRDRLGELVDDPGWLETPLAVRTESGRLGAFTYPAAPTRELLGWLIDHPESLTRPAASASTVEAAVLRRALVDDDPPGSRTRAQDRAHTLLRSSSPRLPTWWRLEEPGRLDCILMTERLVVSVTAPDERGGLRPATPWYPQRSELVRDLEAAKRLAGGRVWATLLISDAEPPAALIGAGAPHLDDAGRAALADAYLGRLSWAALAAIASVAGASAAR